MHGRTDHAAYPAGARTLKNFFVTPEGVLMNRAGTQRGATVFGAARIIPFVFDEDDNFLLVFSDLQIHVFARFGDTSLGVSTSRYAIGNAVVRTIASPYREDDLAGLRCAQYGNVVTIAHPDFPPYELRRTNTYDIELSLVSFDVPDFVRGHALPGFAEIDPYVDHSAGDFGGDASHPPIEWTWQVTRIMRLADGRTYETAPFTIESYQDPDGSLGSMPSSIAVYPDMTRTILINKVGGTQLVGFFTAEIDSSRVYRGREGRFGFVGESKGDTFTDDGAVPDFSNPPPQEFNPFKVMSGDTVVRTENPTVVAFFEGRRIFAATPERPDFIWASATQDYSNFDRVIPPDPSDALSFALASNRSEKIRAVLPREQLFVLTSVTEWLLTGSGQSEIVTPQAISAHPLSHHGCASKPTLDVGSAIFYMQAKGGRPRVISVGQKGISNTDASKLSRHLFEGHTIVDWAYAADPFSVVWAVRDDGVLLSFTYVEEENVFAWARHEISDDGLVEWVAVKPEGNEDAVYVVVNRSEVRTIERLAWRTFDDIRDAIFLDRSVSKVGRVTVASTYISIDDYHANGGAVGQNVRIYNALGGIATGQVIQIDADDGDRPIRLLVGASLGIDGFEAQVLNRVPPSYDAAAGTGMMGPPPSLGVPTGRAYSQDQFYICFTSVTGLEHLEGRTVTAVVDGDVINNLVVAGGVNLPDYAAVAHVGVSYESDLESLDAIQERHRQKVIKAAWVELEATRGGLVAAELGDNMTEVRTREVSDNFNMQPAKRIEARYPVRDKYASTGRIAFRQDQPLPVTVLGITREIEYGG